MTAQATTRDATVDDLPALIDMGVRFHAWSPYSDDGATRDDIADGIGRVFEVGFARVLEVDGRVVGMFLGLLAPRWFTARVVDAAELAWWVEPDHRHGAGSLRLLRDFEAWGRERGVRQFTASDLDHPDSPAGRVFEAMGYVRANERIWTKRAR